MSSTIAILEGIQSGDQLAEASIVEKYYSRLIRLASLRLSRSWQSKFDPDDVVQSVLNSFFLSYRKGKLSFESKNELWGFLVRLTTIKCCEKSRYLGCSKRDAKREQGVHYTPEELRQLVSREPSPEDVATFNEVYDQFTSSLSPLQRQIAELKLMDFSNREISERLDRSERTVYRILRQLRTKIAKSSSW